MSLFTIDITLRKDFARLPHDSQRAKRYRIVEGDSLASIAQRLGFWPPSEGWRTVYEFKGPDGVDNRTLLRSGSPESISPGEEIWVPDIEARTLWQRSLELTEKTFTTVQIDTMRRWIDSGKTDFRVGPPE